jgi:hypothetical protein
VAVDAAGPAVITIESAVSAAHTPRTAPAIDAMRYLAGFIKLR